MAKYIEIIGSRQGVKQGKNEEEKGKKEGSRDLYDRISRLVNQPPLNPAH